MMSLQAISKKNHQTLQTNPKAIIIGGGFGGISAAKALARTPLDLVIIDKTSQHLFQPLLYQVATATLEPSHISTSITSHLSNQKNAKVIKETVIAIDKIKKKVLLSNGQSLPYNYLIVAAGSSPSYNGFKGWEEHAPGLKTVEDAINIRQKIFSSFQLAEQCQSLAEQVKHLRFVVVGGGPTGVELAGAIAELAKERLKSKGCKITPKQVEVVLLHGGNRLLSDYPQEHSNDVQRYLEKLDVKVLLNSKVTKVTHQEIYLESAKKIETYCTIWAGGNVAPSFLKTLSTPQDLQGRIKVKNDLSIPGHSEVFVIGDAALALDRKGNPLPSLAPVAMQQGHYVGSLIHKKISPSKRPPFKYCDRGKIAIVGKFKAVLVTRWIQMKGLLAWIIWKIVHLWYLSGARNKFRVFRRWISSG